MDIEIRQVDERDREALATVETLFRDYAAQVDAPECFAAFEAEVSALPGAYAPPGGRLFLAVRDGDAVGVVALRGLDAGRAEIKRLYVVEDAAGQGIGGALLDHCLNAARSLGYERVLLDTLADRMSDAVRLYRRRGFAEIEPYLAEPTPGATCFALTFDRGS